VAWDFSTDPDWAAQLEWVNEFVRSECEPIDLIVKESHDLNDPVRQALIPPLQKIVKERGLWATHLGAHLGGPGYGQMKLALLNEILGRSECAPIVFGSQAPDSGNSEILAHYGTPELKRRYLEPLLDNRIVSCFSMTEPQGGADPKVFTTSAVQDGDDWVINGEKWFSSFASIASFLIVMAMTDPDAPPYHRYSMWWAWCAGSSTCFASVRFPGSHKASYSGTSNSCRRWSPTPGWRSRRSGSSRCRQHGKSISTTTIRQCVPTSPR
jgi:alkylation response protein AidB-like acyl-CoA dehydrogenase